MFFETRVLWGDAGFFALFAAGCLSWLLLGWILAPAGAVFVVPQGGFCVPRGYILSPSCRSGVSLRPQEPVIAKSLNKYEKRNDLAAYLGAFWDTF